jgi:hypothetical protein
MADRPEGTHTDERLAHLLDVERRLEARVREAEAAARARVVAAQEAARRAGVERSAGFDSAARLEEEADLDRHAAALREIAQESAARVARLSAVTGDALERLAMQAVAVVLSVDDGGAP